MSILFDLLLATIDPDPLVRERWIARHGNLTPDLSVFTAWCAETLPESLIACSMSDGDAILAWDAFRGRDGCTCGEDRSVEPGPCVPCCREIRARFPCPTWEALCTP